MHAEQESRHWHPTHRSPFVQLHWPAAQDHDGLLSRLAQLFGPYSMSLLVQLCPAEALDENLCINCHLSD